MAPAPTHARSDGSLRESYPAREHARIEALLAANINPRTGLATDYLNHFNEAIMLLDMIPDMPECAEDFIGWQPLTYKEHFEASNLKAKDLIIQTYEQADAALRAEFDEVIGTMTAILVAVGEGMRQTDRDRIRATLAEQAAGWVRPLLASAGALIHGSLGGSPGGSPEADDVERIMEQ